MKPRIPDWLLERYALGELPPEQMATLRARIAADAETSGRLAALQADDAAFLAAHPPERVVPGLLHRASLARTASERPALERHVPQWTWLAVPMLAAAAALVVSVPGETQIQRPAELLEAERIKGITPQLHIFRSTNGRTEPLSEGASAHAGDLLQVSYVAAGRGYGVIVSIDGNGTVTPHAGTPHGIALALDRGGAATLDQAYELDDAPAFERFFLVTATTPFAAGPVFEAARSLATDPERASHDPLALPPGLEQSSVTLLKEHP